jgi:putative tryptophan/tyrosine transport system substrate-binding protein
MRRRDFIKAIVSSVAAAWPFATPAQQAMPVIGFVHSGSPGAYQHLVASFHQGLKETGYVQNVVIEFRWADGHYDRLPAMVAELIRRQVNVIAALTTPAALAAEASKTTIPIIFDTAGDPVRLGLVASLNRPGRNITGVAWLGSELVAKRLGLLRDLIPTATAIGLLVNPSDQRTKAQVKDMQEAAHALGLQIHILNASSERELNAAFAKLAELRVSALIVGTGELFNSRTEQLAGWTAQLGLPAIYQAREFVTVGGLMSYGASRTDAYRQTGITSVEFSRAKSPRTCRSRNRPNLNWSST